MHRDRHRKEHYCQSTGQAAGRGTLLVMSNLGGFIISMRPQTQIRTHANLNPASPSSASSPCIGIIFLLKPIDNTYAGRETHHHAAL